ncbi:hypothetical protein EBB07_28455 [Paenibacillaceae bacterium]|nr:hypothetical protein EBB07_28455 [Paenibacillaceae bacterium]
MNKHGLNQYRLNYAKGYAKEFFEMVSKIELMYQLSVQGLVDDSVAESYIKRNIDELDAQWEYFKGYIEQRENMK